MNKKEELERQLAEIREQEKKEHLDNQRKIFDKFKDAKFLLHKRNEHEKDWKIQLIEVSKVNSVEFVPTNDLYPYQAKGYSICIFNNFEKNCTISESNDKYTSIGSENQGEYSIITEQEYEKYLRQIVQIQQTFIGSLKSLLV